MLTGDEEEHAVLLTNYFLHMGKDAYLCVGELFSLGVAFSLSQHLFQLLLLAI